MLTNFLSRKKDNTPPLCISEEEISEKNEINMQHKQKEFYKFLLDQ